MQHVMLATNQKSDKVITIVTRIECLADYKKENYFVKWRLHTKK